ncbi:DUF4047 domain-containing protein [Bacillus spongiae]|uniref:DUF4047 domain-containing protein n=1 Tax=Bacillus spongiae TaxID=2683610 RepID=A0ABU8HES1_9BACI
MSPYKKIILISVSCTMVYFVAGQVGETGASFSNQEETMVQITAAFVFPSTIKSLEENIHDKVEEIIQSFNHMPQDSSAKSLLKLKSDKEMLLKQYDHLIIKWSELQHDVKEVKQYASQAKISNKSEEFLFVTEAFNEIEKIISGIEYEKKLLEIEETLTALDVSISILEEKEAVEMEKMNGETQDIEGEHSNIPVQESPIQNDQIEVDSSEESN